MKRLRRSSPKASTANSSTHADVADAMAMTENAADARAAIAAKVMTAIAAAAATKIPDHNVAFAGIRVCGASRLL